MSQVAINILVFLRSAPGTACCVGAAAYLGWAALFAFGVRQLPAGVKDAAEQLHPSRRLGTSPRRSAAVSALTFLAAVAVVAALFFVRQDADYDCPANALHQTESDVRTSARAASLREDSLVDPFKHVLPRNETRHGVVRTKSKLLARAHAAMRTYRDSTPEQDDPDVCLEWSPDALSQQSQSQLRSQLACFRKMMDAGVASHDEVLSVLSQSKQVFEAMRTFSHADAYSWNSSVVDWANLRRRAVQAGCSDIESKLQELRKAKASPDTSLQALAVLRRLSGFEYSFRETFSAIRDGADVLRYRDQSEVRDELEQLNVASGSIRACLISATREARFLSAALPQQCTHVQNALRCEPSMLERIEKLAVLETPAELDAGSQFNLGLYWSDLEVSGRESPFGIRHYSGEGAWVPDAHSYHVPENIAKAEEYLLIGEQFSEENEKDERAATRALRLYQHAKALALKHHDSAAEWRFLAAAKLAATHKRQKLAAHSMARLSYFVMLRGRHNDALDLASRALTHFADPLAQFIKVTLRRSLGELRTDDDLRAAEQQLSAVANKLPSKALEEQRASAHVEMTLWREAADGGYSACFPLVDAARVLVCLLCKAVFR